VQSGGRAAFDQLIASRDGGKMGAYLLGADFFAKRLGIPVAEAQGYIDDLVANGTVGDAMGTLAFKPGGRGGDIAAGGGGGGADDFLAALGPHGIDRAGNLAKFMGGRAPAAKECGWDAQAVVSRGAVGGFRSVCRTSRGGDYGRGIYAAEEPIVAEAYAGNMVAFGLVSEPTRSSIGATARTSSPCM
jgi:hypothetical protein